MVTALDTNVLSLLLLSDVRADIEAAKSLLQRCHKEGEMRVCGVVYAELVASPGADEALIDSFLKDIRVSVDWVLPERVWRLAANAYKDYAKRRRKQKDDPGPRRLLADFMIGAHALYSTDRLATFDKGVFRSAFPKLSLL